MTAVTSDALLGGRIRYQQPAAGYRVCLEAPLLARFALDGRAREPRAFVDLGAGPGAVGLTVLALTKASAGVLVEVDPVHAVLANTNLSVNGWAERARAVQAPVADVDRAIGRGAFDLVLANPPWFDEAAGASASDQRRRTARTLDGDGLAPFVRAARQLLGRGGRFVVTFPAPRLGELLALLGAVGLVAKRARFLHPRAGRDAQVVFVEAKAARPGGLVVEPPWFVRGSGDEYTPEMRALLWT